ncbi:MULTISPECIES: DUF3231 family protein [Cytobacillus]|uniref:DUF3231 family protein n=1 Tax=Cytobacillus TaxID=2675230 RepID=UPI00203A7CCA|nr:MULTISPECIES: DUF3231 family protein [Cytobacillus]MCM3391129.1 DUF3231 family protein [Cytobacillus oceanisediminis]UQX52744.1 DUF3231 family protein [Cytobacillus pseudoceanisediminis]
MPEKSKISSSELGALWMTYQKKTMILRILEYFIEKSKNPKAKNLMSGLREKLHPKVVEIKKLLQNEGAAVPNGFTDQDVNLNAPILFENGFDIMFCRILKEISMGMYVLHLTMAYRKDIIKLYRDMTDLTQEYYGKFTQFLLDEGLLPSPTFINFPKSADFVTSNNYLKGTNILGQKRPINTVEFGLLYHGIETNITGMQLMAGFAQCAEGEEVRKYFLKGKELSKEIIKEFGEKLLQNDIQPPATSGGTVINSTEAPFSDKLMIFCTYLLCGFSIGGQGFGIGFSLRNDLNMNFGKFGIEVFEYIREGVKIMISNGWLEEAPRMDV